MAGSRKENELDSEGKFPIVRPWKHFGWDYGHEVSKESWFGRNKTDILAVITKGSDDLRFNRMLAMGMLTEAWDETEFREEVGRLGADDLDRLQLIVWLQHWLSITGMLTYEKLMGIQEGADGGKLQSWCAEMTKKTWEVEPNAAVAGRTKQLAASGKVVGIFHGTFAPPTTTHLWCATIYHQYCDELIVGIDSDELAIARKGPGRDRYPFAKKYSVWKGFPDVVDQVVEVPTNIYKDGRYIEENISEFYRSLGVGMVFFNPTDPGRENRIREIIAAGAVPYMHDSKFGFSASDLMELKEAGKIENVLGT